MGNKNAEDHEFESRIHDNYELIGNYLNKFGFLKMDKEDVVQDTLSVAYIKRDTLRDIDKLEPWLRKIAENMALQHIRKKNKNTICCEDIANVADAQLPGWQTAESDVLSILQSRETFCEIMNAFENLGNKYGRLMELYYIQGYNLHQAARIMELNYNTAKTLHARALKKLKTAMDK